MSDSIDALNDGHAEHILAEAQFVESDDFLLIVLVELTDDDAVGLLVLDVLLDAREVVSLKEKFLLDGVTLLIISIIKYDISFLGDLLELDISIVDDILHSVHVEFCVNDHVLLIETELHDFSNLLIVY